MALPVLPQFIRYGGAGAIGTAAHFATLVALVQFASADPIGASTIGAIAGAVINYALNYRFTFASRRAHRIALPRFAAIAIAGVVMNTLVLSAVLAFVRPHYLAAQVVATGAVLVAGFIANRKWTF
jgi:putative flippase GtrA